LRLLLDTHALIWWTIDLPRLSGQAHDAIADPDNDVLVSAVSALEIATKHRLGKLPEAALLATSFEAEVDAEGFIGLPVSLGHGRLAGALPMQHKDPFDRVLIAQALMEDVTLVSNETLFDSTGVRRIW
jgi:PIN domain nuclease of toxin-antitoxin system